MILIVCGDPNSVNSEIIFKVWKKINLKTKKDIFLIGSYELLKAQFSKLKYKIKISKANFQNKGDVSSLKIIDIPLIFKNPFRVEDKYASKYVMNCLNKAHLLTKHKNFKGIINCPIDKKLLSTTKNIGVTEYLAKKCKIKDNSEVMMIYNKNVSVVPLTTHIKIKDVAKKIKKKLIVKKVFTLNKKFKVFFKKKPRICALGLNPHNNEYVFNSEEVKEIIPAIKTLKKRGVSIYGPKSADTIFVKEYKNFDVILGMYHDQVLSPFKSLFHFDAINITLGLNYIRVSPDHGPALNLIGKNSANYISLLNCIRFIIRNR